MELRCKTVDFLLFFTQTANVCIDTFTKHVETNNLNELLQTFLQRTKEYQNGFPPQLAGKRYQPKFQISLKAIPGDFFIYRQNTFYNFFQFILSSSSKNDLQKLEFLVIFPFFPKKCPNLLFTIVDLSLWTVSAKSVSLTSFYVQNSLGTVHKDGSVIVKLGIFHENADKSPKTQIL